MKYLKFQINNNKNSTKCKNNMQITRSLLSIAPVLNSTGARHQNSTGARHQTDIRARHHELKLFFNSYFNGYINCFC